MPWSWRRTAAWWSASWLTASVAAALALAPLEKSKTQVRFDAQRYDLVAEPPLADPEHFAGWQLGAASVALLLGLAGLTAGLLRRRRRQPG